MSYQLLLMWDVVLIIDDALIYCKDQIVFCFFVFVFVFLFL